MNSACEYIFMLEPSSEGERVIKTSNIDMVRMVANFLNESKEPYYLYTLWLSRPTQQLLQHSAQLMETVQNGKVYTTTLN